MIPRHFKIAFTILVTAVAALAIYMINLQSKTEERAHAAPEASTMAPGKTEIVSVVMAYDQGSVLRRSHLKIPQRTVTTERARAILQSVLTEYAQPHGPHPIGVDSEVTQVLIVNDKLAVINLNSAFAEGHPSGIGTETLTLASLVDTLSVNMPSIEEVRFLVDSKPRETLAGHADLSRSYNVAAVQRAIPVVQ
jgi:hypothetical protein